MNPLDRAAVIALRCIAFVAVAATTAAETFEVSRLEREILVPATEDPVALDFGPDGGVYFIGRAGGLSRWDPATRSTERVGNVPSLSKADAGCLGLALGRDFATSGHLFLLYVPEQSGRELRVSRFTLHDGSLANDSEKILLSMSLEGNEGPAHCGGGLCWDADGNLLIGTGDNSPPQDVPAVHPEEAGRDSRRTAANSQELRGKILRIKPTPDGGYQVPAGNMFADAAAGRPEIYVMGARNPFRIHVDSATGWIIWGDVGGNVDPAFGLGPEGYDEINLTKAPGFYGWPFCSGPNDPWRSFDPRTRQPRGEFFDPSHPLNDSPANSGLKMLPGAIPALLWYPTSPSSHWPQLGSGGRSITGGPVYRFNDFAASDVRLPVEFDGAIFWGEWMRNFLALARLVPDGTLTSVERFMPDTIFRKPADLRFGPDGALYLAEYGDAWSGNANGQITRVLYRRGNRPPRAVMAAQPVAGPAPLRVLFDARGSSDPETTGAEGLQYDWDFKDGERASGAEADHVFRSPGRYAVELIVRDPQGARARATTVVDVGNTPPVVRFAHPLDGGFMDYGAAVDYLVEASDAEDGTLPDERVSIHIERRDRAAADDEAVAFPGLIPMRSGTCFACHRTAEASAGPGYLEVAKKYDRVPAARETLAEKIIRGGVGVWGQVPMPPHPQVTTVEARQMVDWILSLATRDARRLPPGLKGQITIDPPPREWGAFSNGVVVVTAVATDQGTPEAPPLSTESSILLRTRRQWAAAFDRSHGVITQHNLESGLVARLKPGSWFAFDRVRLGGLARLQIQLSKVGDASGRLQVRLHRPDGPVIADGPLSDAPSGGHRRPSLTFDLPPLAQESSAPSAIFFSLVGATDAACDIEWIEFR